MAWGVCIWETTQNGVVVGRGELAQDSLEGQGPSTGVYVGPVSREGLEREYIPHRQLSKHGSWKWWRATLGMGQVGGKREDQGLGLEGRCLWGRSRL